MKNTLWMIIALVTGIVGFLLGYSVSGFTGSRQAAATAGHAAPPHAEPAAHAPAGGYAPAAAPAPRPDAGGYAATPKPAPLTKVADGDKPKAPGY
jgi:hypothetical protein